MRKVLQGNSQNNSSFPQSSSIGERKSCRPEASRTLNCFPFVTGSNGVERFHICRTLTVALAEPCGRVVDR
jgi:hypothetical protein